MISIRLGGIALAALMLISSPAGAQRGRGNQGGFFGCGSPPIQNIPYDGQFTFVRLMYAGAAGNCYYNSEPSWAHGYGFTGSGTAESNLMQIMSAISGLRPHLNATNVLAIDDPLLFRYPIAFIVETGYLTLTEKEVTALRKYLLKGGFLIIDDSRDDYERGMNGWANTAAALRRIFPDLRPIDMDVSMPVFHSFFEVPSFSIVRQYYDQTPPVFRGIFAGNDPKNRLMVMINFNTDISNYWEFSPTGFKPVDESNEAFKLGVNYLFYPLVR